MLFFLWIFPNPETNLFEEEKKKKTLLHIQEQKTANDRFIPSIICIWQSNVSVTVASCIPIVSPGRRACFFSSF